MIVVIGGTGVTGSAVVAALKAKGADFKCMVRDTAAARAKLGDDVALVEGDLGNPESLDAALAGCDKMFLLSGHSPVMYDQQKAGIDAARRAGVKHLVKMSGSEKMISPDCPTFVGRDLYRLEEEIKADGLAWTMLRPNFFMQNFLRMADMVKGQGKLMAPIPGDVAITMVDVRDTGDVAAAVLTEPGHEGQSYFLTGAPVTMTDVAAELSSALDKEIPFVTIPIEGAQAAWSGMGMPDWLIAHQTGAMQLVASGDMGGESDSIEKVAGHPPRALGDFIAEHKAVFAS
jgi:uncharacterized protein YbjT (DUF2867 family)